MHTVRIRIPAGQYSFFHYIASSPAVGPTQHFILWILGAGREADHSAPSSAEAKNGGVLPPVPHTSSKRDAVLLKHRDDFALHLLTATLFVLAGFLVGYFSTLKIEAVLSFETLVYFYQTTRFHMQEDDSHS